MTASAFVALLDGGKREETVRVTQEGPGLYVVELRGKRHQVDAFRHDHGTVSLLVDEQSFSVQLDQREAGVRVWIRGDAYPLELLDERRLRMRRASGALTASVAPASTGCPSAACSSTTVPSRGLASSFSIPSASTTTRA